MTTSPSVSLAPQQVLQIASGARQAKVLIVATELGVFTALADGPLRRDELVAALGLASPGARDFLHSLVGLDLLERAGDRYANSAAADLYLVRGRPQYIGGFLRFLDKVLHQAWDGLADSLRTGRPQNLAAAGGDPYHELYSNEAHRDEFLAAMDTFNTPIARALAGLDWPAGGHVVDVGGARGNLAVHLAKAHPDLTVTVFDLPEVRPAFDRRLAEEDLGSRVRFEAGDFFRDPLPAADAVVFGHVLHNWPATSRIALLRSARRALRPGGLTRIYEALVDEETPRLPNVLASLNMLVWSAGGSGYTFDEAAGWLRAAGFGPAARTELGPATSLVTAATPI